MTETMSNGKYEVYYRRLATGQVLHWIAVDDAQADDMAEALNACDTLEWVASYPVGQAPQITH